MSTDRPHPRRTPGPWHVTAGYDVRGTRDGRCDAFIASVFGAGTDEKLGNAAMIAAAPEMHAALVGFVEALTDPAAGPITTSHLEAARRALEKAEALA